MKCKQKYVAILSGILLIAPLITYAAGLPTQFENPLGSSMTFSIFIQRILTFFLALMGFIALLAITFGGVMIVLGGMKSEQDLKRGKEIIFWAIMGLLIVAMAATILGIIRWWIAV